MLCRKIRSISAGEAVALSLLAFSVVMLFFSGIRPMRFLIMLIPPMSMVAALALDRWLRQDRLWLPARFGRLFPLFLQASLTYLFYQVLAALLMLIRMVRVQAGPNNPSVVLGLETLYTLLIASLLLAIASVMAFLWRVLKCRNELLRFPASQTRRAIAALLIGLIISSDFYQYWTWARQPEYSIVEASRLVGATLDPETTVLGGTYAYTLALENDLPAVWFFSRTPEEERKAAGVTHFVRSYEAADEPALQIIEAEEPCAGTFYLRRQLVKLCEVR
jgi:hypothetical protein